MKEQLIKLAKEKGFASTFLYNFPYKYSEKEKLRWLFWLIELQNWLRKKQYIYLQVYSCDNNLKFNYNIKVGIDDCCLTKEKKNYSRNSWEEALESGLQEALNYSKI